MRGGDAAGQPGGVLPKIRIGGYAARIGGAGRPEGATMTRPGTEPAQWTTVDEGWGRLAADFATLSEPGNCREYVAMHHRLGGDAGDRVIDVAGGSGVRGGVARPRRAAR